MKSGLRTKSADFISTKLRTLGILESSQLLLKPPVEPAGLSAKRKIPGLPVYLTLLALDRMSWGASKLMKLRHKKAI
jgi:hypothetical protein